MKLEDYFYLAWTSLSERRGRSIGAVLGVIIAVLALSLALGIGQSFQRVFEEEIGKTLAANSIFLISNTGFTDADIAYLRNIPGVRTVFGVGVGSGVVIGAQGEKIVSIIAVEPEYLPTYLGINSLDDLVEEGSTTIQGLGVIVGSGIWRDEQTGKKVRDVDEPLTIILSGRQKKELTVVITGLAKPVGRFGGPMTDTELAIYMHPSTYFQYVSRKKMYRIVIIVLENVDIVEDVENEVRALVPPNTRIFSPIAMVKQVGIFVSALQTILASLSSVGIGVTGLWIFDSMTISVIQRTKEIGILKALGFKSRDILLLFLIESLLISLMGSTIGSIVALVLSNFIGIPVFGLLLKIEITPAIVVFSTAIPIIVNILAALFPARRGANLDPVRALRYE